MVASDRFEFKLILSLSTCTLQVIYDGKKGYYPDFRHTGELETTSLTLTVQNLYPGTKYNFVIIATTHCASSENSSVVSSQTLKDGRWNIFVIFRCERLEHTGNGLN